MCGAVVRGPGGTDGALRGAGVRCAGPAVCGAGGAQGYGVLRRAGWRRAEVRCAAGRGLAARGGCPSAAGGFRYQTEGGPTGRLPYL